MQFNILKVLDDMCIFSDINIVISVISMCLISFYVIFPHFSTFLDLLLPPCSSTQIFRLHLQFFFISVRHAEGCAVLIRY